MCSGTLFLTGETQWKCFNSVSSNLLLGKVSRKLPDHILTPHLHCPCQCLLPPCPQPGTGCRPSVPPPVSCVLVGLALPVSFSKTKGNDTEISVSNKNETTLATQPPQGPRRKAHFLLLRLPKCLYTGTRQG